VVEGRLREGEKLVGAALPIQTSGFGRNRRSAPKLDGPPDPRAVVRLMTLLHFASEIRLCANYGGFSAMHAKVTEKLGHVAEGYVEEVLDHLRTGDVADVALAHDFLMIAADVLGLVRDEKASEMVRRRAATACVSPPPDKTVILDA
jgi:hypothetical protein